MIWYRGHVNFLSFMQIFLLVCHAIQSNHNAISQRVPHLMKGGFGWSVKGGVDGDIQYTLTMTRANCNNKHEPATKWDHREEKMKRREKWIDFLFQPNKTLMENISNSTYSYAPGAKWLILSEIRCINIITARSNRSNIVSLGTSLAYIFNKFRVSLPHCSHSPTPLFI